MENPHKVTRGKRKENIQPCSSNSAALEQRNIQKNVHHNLFLDSFRHGADSRHRSGAAIRVSDYGKSQVAPVGGAKPQRRVLVQTNLSCPYQAFSGTPSGVSAGSPWQQSNLETKLRRCRSENTARVGDRPCLSAVDLGPSRSYLGQVSLKCSPKNDFSGRSQGWSKKAREGLGLHGVCKSCSELSKRRTGNKEPCVLKQPGGSCSLPEGSCRTPGVVGDSFCSTRVHERPSACSLLHNRCLCSETSSRSFSSSPAGPALTLDQLSSSLPPAPTGLQALLCSSQVSADLHSSIQRLQQEAASMGALSSFPRDPKPLPLPHPFRFDPWVSATGRLSTTEQLAGEESCAKQASVRWQSSFARDWGLGATVGALGNVEPHPVGCRCKDARLYTPPVEASSQFWPSAYFGGVGSASVVRQGDESCSAPCFCYFGCCSRVQQVLEGKGTSSYPETLYSQKTLDPGELSSRFFPCSELEHMDTPLSLPSFNALKVSLENMHSKPPVNMGVTMCGTPREVHLAMRSPDINHFGTGSEYVGLYEVQDGLRRASGDPLTIHTLEQDAPFLPAHNALEEIAGQSLGEHSSAATDGTGPSVFGRSASGSKNSSNEDCWPDAERDQSEESPAEKKAEGSKCPRCDENCHGMDAVQKEAPGRNNGSMDGERNRALPRSSLLLAKCFAAWHNQVFGKRAAARALYERQLLRKGLGALKWAVELRDVQTGVARRRHNWTVLAASFCRWRDAMVKQREKHASQVEMETHGKDAPAAPGETIAKCPAVPQLSAECLEAAAQYSRAEGNLWLQNPHNQGWDQLCRKAQAVRDMRRLAAAFRIWRLQKKHLEEEESRAREAGAFLEKKMLKDTFQTWRSRCRATQQVLPLMAQIQQRLVRRCFKTWKGLAEREARGRGSLDRRRVKALRLCFRQWALMVQVREQARKTLVGLLTLRQKTAYARFGFSPKAPQTHLNVETQSERSGPEILNGLYMTLALQETFYTWRARWCQQQQLDTCRHTVERRQLREALGRWRWKALCLSPLGHGAGDLAEERLLAALDLEEDSLSSGFHSSTPALPASSDAMERESSLMGSSPGSISSLGTVADSGNLPRCTSPSPTLSPGQEDLGDGAAEFLVQASYSLKNQGIRKDGFVRETLPLEILHPDCEVHPVTVSSSMGVARSRGDEKEVLENQTLPLLARCFSLWSSRTLQNLKGKMLCRHHLLSWAFMTWSDAGARRSAQHKAQVWLENSRQPRLLASYFKRWKEEVLRAKQQREEKSLCQRPAGHRAVWRWRKAIRGYRALHRNTGTVVQQSCNYWTKAAAFHLCLRERGSLVGAPKFMKMPLSWPSKQRRSREEGPPPSLAVHARLNGSAFHVWLMIYRGQSGPAGPSQPGTSESPGGAEWRGERAQIQNGGAEMDSRRWLWRKYLRVWRRNILLRRFQDSQRMCYLVRAWLLWKDACRTEWVVQALVGQRLTQRGWKMWRRRYLQAGVAEHFLEAQNRSLLERAFGRWRHLAAKAK